MKIKLSELWLRVDRAEVEKALKEGDGKLLPKDKKRLQGIYQGHLEKETVALRYVQQHLGAHANAWLEQIEDDIRGRAKPYKRDCTEAEWEEISARVQERNLHGAVRRLKKERAKVNCRVALAKLDTVASGQTMEEKAQHDKGYTVDDLLHEVDELLALTKVEDRRDAAE